MKIGLLTLPFNNNYGGFLQCYALKEVLSRMGHDVTIINRQHNKKKKTLKQFLRNKATQFLSGKNYDKQNQRISKYTVIFQEENLTPITKPHYTRKSLQEDILDKKFDAIIVGSDQVWRYLYTLDLTEDFFLGFTSGKDTLKISYAASFGIDYCEYPEDVRRRCATLLKDFHQISVREDSSIPLLYNSFNVAEDRAKVVLDPTLLLKKEDYQTLVQKKRLPTRQQYLLSYILDSTEEKDEVIKHVSNTLMLNTISLRAQASDIFKLEPIRPVEEWLNELFHADFVITDSFHGTVFSILFNKPFLVFGNTERGKSRFDSLLNKFGLTDRYFTNLNEVEKKIRVAINWNYVNEKLDQERASSYKFLENALKK